MSGSIADFLTVYRVELQRRIRSRPFLIGLIVGALGIVTLSKLPAFLNAHVGVEQGRIVLAGPRTLTAPAATLLGSSYKIAGFVDSTAPPSVAQLDASDAGRLVALVETPDGLHVTVYSTDPTSVDGKVLARLLLPLNLHLTTHVDLQRAKRLTTVPVDVRGVGNRFESLEVAQIARGITFTLIFLLYLLVILNSQLTMAGVIEEKTNRIAELLVSAVDPISLLYGKILAGTTLGIVQMIAWIGAALLAGMVSPPSAAAGAAGASPFSLAGALGGALSPIVSISFVCFFILGLLQFTTIFAGIGSLISRPEDLGAINSAMVLPIVAALLIAIAALDAPNAPIVVASSYVPLLAPFTMFARIATATPPLWQIACSAAINLIALIGIAVLAGKLYRVGMLLYGRPPSLKQVWMTLKA